MALALEAQGIPIQEMADLLGVSRNTVGNYLSGRTTPRLAVLRVWAMRTGYGVDWFLTGDTPTTGPDTPGGLANQTSLCMTDDLAAIRARRSTALLPSTVAA